jgi:hypothetical protein
MFKKHLTSKQLDFKRVSTLTEHGQSGGRQFEHTGSYNEKWQGEM